MHVWCHDQFFWQLRRLVSKVFLLAYIPHQQHTDSNPRYYLGKILDQAGITKTKTQTQINVILSCWSFAVALIGSWSLDYIGRRKQALICIAGMITCLYIIGGMIKGNVSSNSQFDPQHANLIQYSARAPTHPASMAQLRLSSSSRASTPFLSPLLPASTRVKYLSTSFV